MVGNVKQAAAAGNLGLTRTRGIDALDIIISLGCIFRRTIGVKR